jgi:long-chain acyl-CoA synthetase
MITDRKKDLIVTAAAWTSRPRTSRISEGRSVHQPGDGLRRSAPVPVALITINPEELSKFAREQGIPMRAAAIVKHPKVAERVGRTVEEKNTQRSPTPRSSASRSRPPTSRSTGAS